MIIHFAVTTVLWEREEFPSRRCASHMKFVLLLEPGAVSDIRLCVRIGGYDLAERDCRSNDQRTYLCFVGQGPGGK